MTDKMPYTPPNESRCTATTKRGTRCRNLVAQWRPDTGPDPRVCGGHMPQEQRTAIKDAEHRERAAWFQALPDEQRALLQRRAAIFRSGEPACWSWPTTPPHRRELPPQAARTAGGVGRAGGLLRRDPGEAVGD